MMRVPRKSTYGLVLIGILSASLMIPEAYAAQNLWAWVRKERRYVTSAQAMIGTASLTGTFAYNLGIWNPGPGPVKGATIEFTSTHAPNVQAAETAGLGDAHTIYNLDSRAYRYVWRIPDISKKSSQWIWVNSRIGSTFTAGFDASKEVNPTLLESRSGIQEVKVRVRPVERFTALDVGISLEGSSYVGVKLEKKSASPKLYHESGTWISWRVENAQTGRLYEFSVTLRLTNRIFPSRVDFAPWIEVMAYESTRDYPWSTSTWYDMALDPETSVSNVTIGAPATSKSTVQLQVARTVGFLGSSTAELKTTIVVEGLPPTESSSLYADKNGRQYHLQVDGLTG